VDETPSQHEAVQAVGEALSALRESSIAELEVEWEGGSLRIHREAHGAVARPAELIGAAASTDDRAIIVSEHVGIFRGGAGGPFPRVGAWISAGTSLGEIETLGIRNVVAAPIDGRVDEVLVEDGAPVEYGQRLAAIRPESMPTEPSPAEESTSEPVATSEPLE
jgi:acetyl-CoA carboxylase biotin carboxyl carrier protein